jgi:hypothetical protein
MKSLNCKFQKDGHSPLKFSGSLQKAKLTLWLQENLPDYRQSITPFMSKRIFKINRGIHLE